MCDNSFFAIKMRIYGIIYLDKSCMVFLKRFYKKHD